LCDTVGNFSGAVIQRLSIKFAIAVALQNPKSVGCGVTGIGGAYRLRCLVLVPIQVFKGASAIKRWWSRDRRIEIRPSRVQLNIWTIPIEDRRYRVLVRVHQNRNRVGAEAGVFEGEMPFAVSNFQVIQLGLGVVDQDIDVLVPVDIRKGGQQRRYKLRRALRYGAVDGRSKTAIADSRKEDDGYGEPTARRYDGRTQ
jgi:hypothetical protein